MAERRANNEYDNAGRRLFEAYQNIEQKMKQIEGLAQNFIKASKNYVNNQHDMNTKTYIRALETLASHKKAADLLASKIKETSDKVAQFGAITTTLKPCSKSVNLVENSTPTTILATSPISTTLISAAAAILETASISTTAVMETASISTTAAMEPVSISTPAIEMAKASDVIIPAPVAIEATTVSVNNDDIFADSLKNLNLNYNNLLQNIGDNAIEADEVSTVVAPVAVML